MIGILALSSKRTDKELVLVEAVDSGTGTIVTKFDLTLGCEENIVALHIAVDNAQRMEIL